MINIQELKCWQCDKELDSYELEMYDYFDGLCEYDFSNETEYFRYMKLIRDEFVDPLDLEE